MSHVATMAAGVAATTAPTANPNAAAPFNPLLAILLPIVGGFLAALLLRGLDRLAARDKIRREFEAAAALVADELDANIESLRISLNYDREQVPTIQDTTYNQMQLALAQRLTPHERQQVAEAYKHVRVPRALGLRHTVRDPLSGTVDERMKANLPNIEAAVTKMTEAAAMLKTHLRQLTGGTARRHWWQR